MKPNHKCDPARMALLYIRQQFICTTFKFDAYAFGIDFNYLLENYNRPDYTIIDTLCKRIEKLISK